MIILKQIKTLLGNDVKLLANSEHNSILVIGVFHGDESQGDFLINEYIKKMPNSRLLFIPCLNPDGKVLNTRQNSNKVDLNRNFPTKNWQFSDDKNFFGGTEACSERETAFLIDIIKEYSPSLVLTLHAPYKIVNFDGDALHYAEIVSKIMNYPVQKDIGYPTPGSFGTYCGVERNIPTITLELDEEVPVNSLMPSVHSVFDYFESI